MADASRREVGGSTAVPPPPAPIHPLGQEQEPSIAHLLANLLADAQSLLRKEFDLARAEMLNEVDKVREGAIALGIGAAITAVGGLLLTIMVVQLLIDVANLAPWVAYLIVGGVLTIVGAVALFTGISRMRAIDPVPRETIESVRKDVAWLSQQNPSDKT